MANDENLITEEEREAAARQDAEWRRLTQIQADVVEERNKEAQWKRLSQMSAQEFARFCREQGM